MTDLKKIVIFIGNANNFGHTRTTIAYISCFLRLHTEVFVYCRRFDNILHKKYNKNKNLHFYKSLKEISKIIKNEKIRYGLKVDYDLSPIVLFLCKMNKIKLLSLYCTLVNKFRYYNEKSCVVISREIQKSITNLRNDSMTYLITNRVSKKKIAYKSHESIFDSSSVNVIRITQFSNHYQKSNLRLVNDFCKISKKYKLWLIGSGDNKNIKILKDVIHKRDINCCVFDDSTGNLDNYILDSDLVVGTGRTAIDALYFAKPLIVPSFEGLGLYVTLNKNNTSNLLENNLSGRNYDRNYRYSMVQCLEIIESEDSMNFVKTNYRKIYLSNYSDDKLEQKLHLKMFEYVDSNFLSLILE